MNDNNSPVKKHRNAGKIMRKSTIKKYYRTQKGKNN